MNPYWINQQPDTDEFLHSDRVKRNFILLVLGHIVLWVLSLFGIIYLYSNAQTTAPIEAFTSTGEMNHGQLIPINSAAAQEKQEAFLDLHLRNVFSHLFMRTEKGFIPQLRDYTDGLLLATIDANFNFSGAKKGGYSQTMQIQEFEKIQVSRDNSRRVYRIHGVLSSHSLEGSSDLPMYLIAAVDRRPSTPQNPLGWVVSIIIEVDSKEYYNKERQSLIDEVTKARDTLDKSGNKAGAKTPEKAPATTPPPTQ